MAGDEIESQIMADLGSDMVNERSAHPAKKDGFLDKLGAKVTEAKASTHRLIEERKAKNEELQRLREEAREAARLQREEDESARKEAQESQEKEETYENEFRNELTKKNPVEVAVEAGKNFMGVLKTSAQTPKKAPPREAIMHPAQYNSNTLGQALPLVPIRNSRDIGLSAVSGGVPLSGHSNGGFSFFGKVKQKRGKKAKVQSGLSLLPTKGKSSLGLSLLGKKRPRL